MDRTFKTPLVPFIGSANSQVDNNPPLELAIRPLPQLVPTLLSSLFSSS